ncbi:glycosyltransferase family 4 protein [Limibaculum sp. FT325]|uniref:glycosyltransferase family 4 protein n=1 Tax=Thermohalobaculum sediminis TaxID=2939436 RepID=UPI0020C0B5F1|nr:glycosyltransferase family 4 protein [Limibaculum sediminis]MCL5778140.1 glycosyltransferase family 4 protein [Limibaculum sediminis]
MAAPLAVVLKGYPRLSETFIAQELAALEARGHEFEIWSLRQPYDDRIHPIHEQIRARRRYLPEYLWREPLRVLRSVTVAAGQRGFRKALGIWLRDLARDLSANRVRRFGQACVLAAELPRSTRFIYAHFLHTPASVARYAALIRGIGWGFSAHAKDIWTIPDWEKREKIAAARFGVTCTRAGAEHLAGLDAGGQVVGDGKIGLVYHGLDLGRFPPPPDIRPHRQRFNLLSVGRLVEKKGYDDLIEALAELPAGLEWHLVHIGGGKLERELRARARAAGIDARIEWRGKRDQTEVIDAMRRADLFVLPSKIAGDGDRDGLPNVLMEAASQKLPILSTAIAAIPEFIEDGAQGRLVPPADPAALRAAILELAADPGLRRRLADAAHRRLIAEFGMEAGIRRIDRALRAALAGA